MSKPKQRKRWVEGRRGPCRGDVAAKIGCKLKAAASRVQRDIGTVVFWPEYWQQRLDHVLKAKERRPRSKKVRATLRSELAKAQGDALPDLNRNRNGQAA
jgi:hypothetical protein